MTVLKELLKRSLLSNAHAKERMSEGYTEECVQRALDSLDLQTREIVGALYGLDDTEPCTKGQVARKYGLTKERIEEIEAAALAILMYGPSTSRVKRIPKPT